MSTAPPGSGRAMIFEPHRAIVTASDSGIGRATAVDLAASGLDIGVTWHRDEAGAAGAYPRLSRSNAGAGAGLEPTMTG